MPKFKDQEIVNVVNAGHTHDCWEHHPLIQGDNRWNKGHLPKPGSARVERSSFEGGCGLIYLVEQQGKCYLISEKGLDKAKQTTSDFRMMDMDSIPPNSNPFLHDSYNMGQKLGTNITAMFGNHPTEKMRYLILVDHETGKRVRVEMPE